MLMSANAVSVAHALRGPLRPPWQEPSPAPLPLPGCRLQTPSTPGTDSCATVRAPQGEEKSAPPSLRWIKSRVHWLRRESDCDPLFWPAVYQTPDLGRVVKPCPQRPGGSRADADQAAPRPVLPWTGRPLLRGLHRNRLTPRPGPEVVGAHGRDRLRQVIPRHSTFVLRSPADPRPTAGGPPRRVRGPASSPAAGPS